MEHQQNMVTYEFCIECGKKPNRQLNFFLKLENKKLNTTPQKNVNRKRANKKLRKDKKHGDKTKNYNVITIFLFKIKVTVQNKPFGYNFRLLNCRKTKPGWAGIVRGIGWYPPIYWAIFNIR
eukprot:GEMP01121287.1.p1 GENE.GEMP01121287.1~~GEMP01121287.1.p1  ORF type:complete len:122 (+),score=6.50 GEMP01121287.1:96-461(+)